MAYQPNQSALPLADHPASILSLSYSLSSTLSSTFAPALPLSSPAITNTTAPTSHLLQPLGPLAPSSLPSTRQHLQNTLTSLRSAVTAFSALLPLPSNATEHLSTSRAPGGPTEKYLSLLKETASSEGVLLSSLGTDAQLAQQLLARRSAHAHLYPMSSLELLSPGAGPKGERTLAMLESVATGLGLVTFRETGTQLIGGRAEGTREVHTLSLGGKVMVVDVEVDAEEGRVLKVKVSYVLEAQHDALEVARRLEGMLKGMEMTGNGGDEEEIEKGLKGFRETLRELARLDEITEETTVDCFAAQEAMASCLQSVLDGESGQPPSFQLSSDSHGIYLPRSHTHHSSILYHASVLLQLSPGWTAAKEGGFAAGEALDALLAKDGADVVRVSLVKPDKGVSFIPSYFSEGGERPAFSSDDSPSFEVHLANTSCWPNFATTDPMTSPTFVAHFTPGVPITKAIGKRIMTVLGLGSAPSPPEQLGVNRRGKPLTETTWFEDLLVSPREGPISPFDATDTYRRTFDDMPFSQDFALADPGTIPGYLCTDVRFHSPAQLFKIVEILQGQHLINDLAQSVVSARYRVSPPSRPTGKPSNKRRKVEEPVISLDSLFLPSSRTSLPIFLHLHSAIPSLSLSFPSPHTPPPLASPLALHISVDSSRPSGLKVEFEGKGTGVLDAAKAERVLRVGRNLGLLMRWVVKRLGKEGGVTTMGS